QIQAAKPDTAPGERDQSKQAGPATVTTATGPEKESEPPKGEASESQRQVETTNAAAAPEKDDESTKRVEPAQTAAESEKADAAPEWVKGKKPEDVLRNYLAKINAID